ncbi:MAG: ABC transporter ATP-binding protein [Anaerolineae bacterium]
MVEVREFHFAYPSLSPAQPVPVLRGVNLTVSAGEAVAVMGATGSGKSTLCMALVGLIPHTTGGIVQGDVWVAGKNTKQVRPANLATCAGLLFQDAGSQLFNTIVEAEVAFGPESLGLPPEEIEQRVAWALRAVHMEDFRDRSPFELSGGQQKRVAIAAVLAMRPPVLVLDEPTAGLDPVGKAEVLQVLHELRQMHQATVILTEQDPEVVARLADRVALLEEGRITLQGAPREVLAQIEHLRAAGLRPPQMAELAALLGKKQGRVYRFFTLTEAQATLEPELRKSRPISSLRSIPSTPPLPSLPAPEIRVERASYRYPNDVWGIREADLCLQPGAYLAIVGQNGAGKTTLARLLNGLLRPTQGRVLVGGQATTSVRIGELARQVGLCFQNPDHQIFSDTVAAEVEFGLRNLGVQQPERSRRIEEALERFNLSAHAATPPALLGFGERRKVTLAALYAMRPPVWVLDEPTSGLDARTQDVLVDLLAELHAAGHTVLLITHDMHLVAAHIPQSLVLAEGRILWQGSTRDLFAREDLLARAHLTSPEITALSLALHPAGMPAPLLTVEEFIERFPQ